MVIPRISGSWQFDAFVNFFFFFMATPQYMEVPRPGVEMELQLSSYTPATATPALNCLCNARCTQQLLATQDPQPTE